MESTGEPLKVQASEATKNLIDRHFPAGNISTEERGTVNVKGKGEMHTYWVAKKS